MNAAPASNDANRPEADSHRSHFDRSGRWIPDGSWPFHRQAPGSLENVRRFMNTLNRESGADLFATVVGYRDWLHGEGARGYAGVTSRELGTAQRFRSLLHELVVTNASRVLVVNKNWLALTGLAEPFGVGLTFETPALVAKGSGGERFLAELLIAVFWAKADGSWSCLKACQNAHCRWVYFDQSKNQSATWCADNACGGRTRARSYRARAAANSY